MNKEVIQFSDILKYASKLTRHECRDYAFGDMEVYLMENDNKVGEGYFSNKKEVLQLKVHGETIHLAGIEAKNVVNATKLVDISRNDTGEY